MDLGVESPLEMNRHAGIQRDGEHPHQSPSSGRKRKLQLEQLAMPMSKHKFRHQLVLDESSDDSMDELETGVELHEGPEQTEGSSSKGSGSSSSLLLEASDSHMEDLEGHGEMSPKLFVPHFEPAASPSGAQGKAFKDGRYPDGGVVKEGGSDCQLPVIDAGEGDGELDRQLPVPGAEEGDDEFMEDECLHGKTQELMLLSCEDVGMHALGLSSSRWSIKQDALPGAQRPTIDQEFEHHFSMFML